MSKPPSARLEGDREQLSVLGDEVAVTVTVREKPATRLIVIVDVPGDPSSTLTVVGFASRLKSGRMEASQMLLSTIPRANSIKVLPKGPVVENEEATSMNTPDIPSNVNPADDENEKPG